MSCLTGKQTIVDSYTAYTITIITADLQPSFMNVCQKVACIPVVAFRTCDTVFMLVLVWFQLCYVCYSSSVQVHAFILTCMHVHQIM